MIIDFNAIAEEKISGFKGGEGELLMRSFTDDKCRIMHLSLASGATVGHHLHAENCEVIFMLKGELTFVCDGQEETLHSGQVHYCPKGHAHSYENRGREDVEYFAVVAEHH
ncbi:MAG: cupin domain-containing protein [Prevotella sp.]|nr:cupin domain-containing protein [Prevotella sp.]